MLAYDRNDAEAISEAASRPTMRRVPVRTSDEQAAAIIVKHREMLIGQLIMLKPALSRVQIKGKRLSGTATRLAG